ncbi:MAG: peptidoglycan DD-metalloendopeptidase family protein, partial [Saprospiraceae bacterium]
HQHKNGELVESLYTHCDELHVEQGDYVRRGQQIGTIGTAHGQYLAHLHFEIRTVPDAEIGRGYADVAPPHYEAPTPYIWKYRPNVYDSKFN